MTPRDRRAELGPAWRVRRTGGLLVPGFTKRFGGDERQGTTYLWGVPIGRFDVVPVEGGRIELRYHRWPVVDVLDGRPVVTPGVTTPIDAAGFVSVGGRRARFCRFRLEH